jgi:serine protease AprX
MHNPSAVVANRYFLGSGTSQSAAVVSGAADHNIQQRPNITPDQVRALLMNTAQNVDSSTRCQGAVMIDLRVVGKAPLPRQSSRGRFRSCRALSRRPGTALTSSTAN